jgi:hypothetical protein
MAIIACLCATVVLFLLIMMLLEPERKNIGWGPMPAEVWGKGECATKTWRRCTGNEKDP